VGDGGRGIGEGAGGERRGRDVSSLFRGHFGGHAPRLDEFGRATLNGGVGWLLGASKEETDERGELI
jgi:hypothetical protein